MASIVFKWLLMAIFAGNTSSPAGKMENSHPYFVSVTEIEHNAKEQSIQISCKIFTDDFEKTLRKNCNCYVGLLQPEDKNAMDKLVNEYLQKHLSLKIDGKAAGLKYVGYENIEEAIFSYWEVTGVPAVNTLEVINNILYDYKDEQVNIVHVTIKGIRRSAKLNNPDDKISFDF